MKGKKFSLAGAQTHESDYFRAAPISRMQACYIEFGLVENWKNVEQR